MVLKLKNFEIGGDKLTILAGPCAIESIDIMRKTAEGLKTVCEKLDINYVFKSSYDKANRSSINSYRGVGMEKGLEMLAQIKKEFDLPIVTDIHTPDQAEIAAEVGYDNLLVIGLANDELGYIVPPSDFLLNEEVPYLLKTMDDSGENHYEETNSVGEECATKIAEIFEQLVNSLALSSN